MPPSDPQSNRRTPSSSRSPEATNAWSQLAALPSKASRRLLCELRKLAPSPIPITVVGPSGTGKTDIARGIHAASRRHGGPFVVQNVSVLSDSLSGSEFYGHERGAFTGSVGSRTGRLRSAHGGTLVLDELTKAPMHIQHHLLDILDSRPFFPLGSDREIYADVRVVALTSSPLESAVKAGHLIPDLFERLRTTVVLVSPLDSRADDVLTVVQIALDRWYQRYGYAQRPEVSTELARILVEARWPGNHRQVEGLVQRLLASAEGAETLTPAHLPDAVDAVDPRGARERFLEDYRNGVPIAHAGPTAAARHYGVDRSTIRRWTGEAATTPDSHA